MLHVNMSWLQRGTLGFTVLVSFYCGISVNKIPSCSIAVISNPAVCVVCVFKPLVFGETKLFAVKLFAADPRPTLDRYIDRLSTDISADISVEANYSKHDPFLVRPLYNNH